MAEVAPTIEELYARANQVSNARKYFLLVLFCASQFLDAFKYVLKTFGCAGDFSHAFLVFPPSFLPFL